MVDENQEMHQGNEQQEQNDRSWLGLIIRFVVAAIVLMVTAFITPGFEKMGFGTAILAALVIAGLDYLIQRFFKIDASPFGRGLSGFILAVAIIYLAQFIVPGMRVNIFGSLVAALVIGIIDALIPTNVV